MQRNRSGLGLRKINVLGHSHNELDAAATDLGLARIDEADFLVERVLDRSTLAGAVDGKLKVVGERKD